MKKKVLSLLLVGAMTASMAAGCGNKSDEPTSNNAGGNDAAGTTESADKGTTDTDAGKEDTAKNPITLRTVSMFGGTDANLKAYEAINKQFEADHDWVTLEDNSQSSDEEWKASVNADFSVGNEPDVIQFFVDATADSIVATDKLVSIEEIRAEYPEYAGDTLDSALDMVKNTDGVQRAVPTTGFWEGLYCNTDLFEQYSVDIPTDWDSLMKAVETFKENGIIPIACSLNAEPHYWVEYMMLYSSGIDEYAQIPETAPEGWVKGLELFKTLRDAGAFPADTDSIDNAYSQQLFKSKQAAMNLDGNWFAGQIVEDGLTDTVKVYPFPGVPDQKAEKNTIVSGISAGFYITRKAWDDPDKRDAAVEFVMAHTSKEGVQQYFEATGATAQTATTVDPVDGQTPFAESITDYIGSASALVSPTDGRIGDAYKTLISQIVKVSAGTVTAEDAINESLALIKK